MEIRWLAGRTIGLKYLLIAVLALASHYAFAGDGFSGMDDNVVARMGSHRPLLELTYDFNRKFGGWIETNVLLHAGSSVVAAGLMGPFAGVMLAVHPLAADAVQSVAGRSSLLCGLLVMIAAWLAVNRAWILYAVAVVLAFLVKEEAVIAVVILPFILEGRARLWSIALIAAMMPAGFMATYAAQMTNGLEATGMPIAPTGLERIGLYLSGIASHAVHNFFVPIKLSADPVIGIIVWPLGLAVLIVLGIVAYHNHVGAALAFGSLVIYLFAELPDVMFEHRLYLLVAGMSGIVASALRGRFVAAGLAACMLLSVVTMHRSLTYSRPDLLWKDTLSKGESYRARINYSAALAYVGDFSNAEKTLAGARRTPLVRQRLALYAQRRGSMSDVIKYLTESGT